jgi:pyruvate, water dikinase
MLKQIKALFKKKDKQASDQSGMMNVFRKKYTNFKALLESNAELMKIITGMEEKLTGQHVFGMSYIRSEMARMIFHTVRMISSFEGLSGRKNPELMENLNQIQTVINEELELKNIPRGVNFVMSYDRIGRDRVDFVGGKNANLGEVRSKVRLPIPKGFAITTAAFDELVEYNDLVDEIRKQKREVNPNAPESIIRISENIQRMITDAIVPPLVEKAILEAYNEKISRDGSVKVAIRSSAIGEDSELSFAGQYQSFLNVPPKDIIQKYKEVIASLFTPRAISYRHHMGIPFGEVAMSVACLEMIQSKAGGVIYTRHPFDLIKNNIIINATWGLGSYVVDGVVTPDNYELSKADPPILLTSTVSPKSKSLVVKPDGYLMETEISSEKQNTPCLSEEQAVLLAEYAIKLEAHFQAPQDIEWAMDENNNLLILQTRPLRIEGERGAFFSTQRFEAYPVLVENGSVACPGVGCGQAHIIHSEEDLLSFPEGGVLVAAHSSPQYVIVMDKAQAIVTNSGSITGHMASVAREFKVPTVLNLENATNVIPPGALITVDAFAGRVYEGKVTELLGMQWERGSFMKDTPVYQTLKKLSQYIIPLHLTNPKSRKFKAKNCVTIHDIMRYTHELSYTEVFQISDFTTDHGRISVKLDAPLPIDLYVIDLGGGLEINESSSKIKMEQVVSAPFKALLGGMLHKDLKAFEPRPVTMKGFLSVMSQQMLAPPNPVVERFGDRSYAIVSDKYLNFSSRVGYHYSILDSYCGLTALKNYINFQFKGGAADDVRRNRRARLIKNILEASGFLVEVQGDRVTARFAKQEQEMIAEKLDLLGRLVIYTRQMDMLMNCENSVNMLSAHFLEGKYDLDSICEMR